MKRTLASFVLFKYLGAECMHLFVLYLAMADFVLSS